MRTVEFFTMLPDTIEFALSITGFKYHYDFYNIGNMLGKAAKVMY